MTKTRNYQGRDVEMLTTCAAIVENALKNQEFLASKRSTWAAPFFSSLKTRIDNAFNQYLGMDSAAQQRHATQAVIEIQTQALADLAELKVQIEADFNADKKRRDEILKELGYAVHYKKAQNKSQEALIQLLYCYKSSLTQKMKTEIASKGTAPGILDRIKTYAVKLSDADVKQETQKGSKKTITETAIIEFNAIYNEVISIAKIARNFYKGNTNMQEQFSYRKIRGKLNAAKKAKEQQPEAKA